MGGWPSLHSRIRDKGTSWLPDPRTSGIGDFVAGRAVGNHNGCPTIAAGDLAANRRRALTPGTRCDILRMRITGVNARPTATGNLAVSRLFAFRHCGAYEDVTLHPLQGWSMRQRT